MLKSPSPPWSTQTWFNTVEPLSADSFRGQVIVLYAFQMLCPACVSHGIPQAKRVHELFSDDPVAVVGLHSVFEHHDAMTPTALQAFLHEYRVPFPVAVDQPAEPPARSPLTMRAYGMQGTPSTLLFDAEGKLRRHVFGVYDDLALGRDIGQLLMEPRAAADTTNDSDISTDADADSDSGAGTRRAAADSAAASPDCSADGCALPDV